MAHNEATPTTVPRKPLPAGELRERVLDAKASVQAGFWLFNEEARALVQSHDQHLRDVLHLLEAGEVDDAIVLIERIRSAGE
jgi:hypothetical protein